LFVYKLYTTSATGLVKHIAEFSHILLYNLKVKR